MLKVNNKFKPFLYLIDLIGYLTIKPFLRKDLPEKINKILVIRVDEIGDAIFTTPVFRALKQKFPEAEISALIKPINKAVYENNPNIDKLILTSSWLKSWIKQKASFFDFLKLIKKLKKEDFDLVVELHTDPRNIILASLIGKFSIGYGYRGFGFLLNKRAKPSNKHIIEQNLDVTRLIGADTDSSLDLPLEDSAVKNIRTKLNDNGLDLSKTTRLVCLGPGSGRKNKYWFNESWAKLAEALLKKKNIRIVFTGIEADAGLIKNILSLLEIDSKKITNLCGKTSLQELFALAAHSNLVITPDSAMIHAANALSVPAIGLYGPTDPAIWGYNNKLQKSVSRKLDCSFCNEGTCKLNINQHKCMEWISYKDVLREAETFI